MTSLFGLGVPGIVRKKKRNTLLFHCCCGVAYCEFGICRAALCTKPWISYHVDLRFLTKLDIYSNIVLVYHFGFIYPLFFPFFSFIWSVPTFHGFMFLDLYLIFSLDCSFVLYFLPFPFLFLDSKKWDASRRTLVGHGTKTWMNNSPLLRLRRAMDGKLNLCPRNRSGNSLLLK